MTRRWGKVAFGVVLPACVGVGCGGSESSGPSMSCGEGTHAEGNTCVPDEPDGGAGMAGQAGTGGAGGGGGQDASGGDAGGTQDAGPVDPSGDCPDGLPGPTLIEVSTPGGQRYCIDATEVTGGHYREFRDAKKFDTSGQPPGCEENKYDDGWVEQYPTETEPAFNVDWCDAYMFCEWAGKHLCGAVGGGAIASAADLNNPEKAEWFNACSSGGEYSYPYGDTYDPEACNTYDYGGVLPRPRDVPALLTCHGPNPPFSYVYDMCGNVSEWVNATISDRKVLLGGAYNSEPKQCRYVPPYTHDWSLRLKSIGFRCCADIGD